jgi:hypothetical protein
LSIGTWRIVAKNENATNLMVFSDSNSGRMIYHINSNSAEYQIKYPFTSIKSISLFPGGTDTTTNEDLSGTGGLIIELNRPPEFFMNSFEHDWVLGEFHQCGDFTEDQQASKVLIHHLGGLPGVLDGQLARLTSLESFQKRHDSYDLSGDLRTRNRGTSPQYEATD